MDKKPCISAYHATGENGQDLGWFCSFPGGLKRVTVADCSGCPYREVYEHPRKSPQIHNLVDASSVLADAYLELWGVPDFSVDDLIE